MRKTIYIIIGLTYFISCQKKQKTEIEKPISEFDLITDLNDFKHKMSELDTINIWFDHSVCGYEGDENIKITKQNDSIQIESKFRDMTFNNSSNWEEMYILKLPVNDTIWNFENFLKRNEQNLISSETSSNPMIISNRNKKIKYYTNRLQGLLKFQTDFYGVMRKIYPENKYGIYGVEIMTE